MLSQSLNVRYICTFLCHRHEPFISVNTLPETNSSHLPGCAGPQKDGESSSKHPFSGAMAVSFKEGYTL